MTLSMCRLKCSSWLNSLLRLSKMTAHNAEMVRCDCCGDEVVVRGDQEPEYVHRHGSIFCLMSVAMVNGKNHPAAWAEALTPERPVPQSMIDGDPDLIDPYEFDWPVGYLGRAWHCPDCEAAARRKDNPLDGGQGG